MKKLVLLVAVFSLIGAACSSTSTAIDTSAATAPTNTEAESTGDATDQAPTSEPIETEPTVATDPTAAPTADDATPDSASSDDPTPEPNPIVEAEPFTPSPDQLAMIQAIADSDDWCTAAAAVESGNEVLDDLDFTNPAEVEAGFKMTTAMISAAQRLAPAAIAADVDQSVEGFTAIGIALAEVNWSFLDLDLSVLEEIDAPLELATYNIDLYNFTVCGLDVDPGEPPDTTTPLTDDPSATDLPLDGSIREQAVARLVEAGFSADEANCVLSKLDLSDPEAFADTTALFAVFTECGISLDRLAQLGGG